MMCKLKSALVFLISLHPLAQKWMESAVVNLSIAIWGTLIFFPLILNFLTQARLILKFKLTRVCYLD